MASNGRGKEKKKVGPIREKSSLMGLDGTFSIGRSQRKTTHAYPAFYCSHPEHSTVSSCHPCKFLKVDSDICFHKVGDTQLVSFQHPSFYLFLRVILCLYYFNIPCCFFFQEKKVQMNLGRKRMILGIRYAMKLLQETEIIQLETHQISRMNYSSVVYQIKIDFKVQQIITYL